MHAVPYRWTVLCIHCIVLQCTVRIAVVSQLIALCTVCTVYHALRSSIEELAGGEQRRPRAVKLLHG